MKKLLTFCDFLFFCVCVYFVILDSVLITLSKNRCHTVHDKNSSVDPVASNQL